MGSPNGEAERTPLVIFSPLPPRRNGIADYCSEMLPGLQLRFECTVVVEDGSPGIGRACVPMIQLAEYENRRELASAPHLFHLGNNPDHVYMLPVLARLPGMIVLHDPGLHHLLDTATLGRGDSDGYAAALQAEYGWAGRKLAAQFSRYGLREPRMHVAMPMIRGIVGPARGVIVHSSSAARMVRRQCPDADVHVVPHHVLPPIPAAAELGKRKRVQLGIRNDEFVMMSFGFITPAKQLDLTLRALAVVAPTLPPFRYVIAGQQSDEAPDIMRLAGDLNLSDRVILTGYVSPEEVSGMIGAADVLVNLRYPTLGETSGTLMRAMAQGIPAIVNDVGSFRDFPDDVVARVPWGSETQSLLVATLRDLANSTGLRHRIGKAAARWSLQECSLAGSVESYDMLIRNMKKPKPWIAKPLAWETLPLAALTKLGRNSAMRTTPLWYTAGLAPSPVGPCQILAILANQEERELLVEWIGRSVDLAPAIPAHGEAWTSFLVEIPIRSVDLIIISVPSAILPFDSTLMLRLLNKLLSFGGILILEVDAAKRTNAALEREGAGRDALEVAGFDIEASVGAPPLDFRAPIGRTPSHRCWKATKISEFFTPVPSAASVRQSDRE